MPKIDRIFYAYCLAAGIVLGAALVRWPQIADFTIKPFFWMLGIVAAFDLTAFVLGKGEPGTMLSGQARFIGLLVGIVIIAAVSWWFSIPLRLF
jgi:hypothetical protein